MVDDLLVVDWDVAGSDEVHVRQIGRNQNLELVEQRTALLLVDLDRSGLEQAVDFGVVIAAGIGKRHALLVVLRPVETLNAGGWIVHMADATGEIVEVE